MTYDVDCSIEAPKTRVIQIGRITTLVEINISAGETGIICNKENTCVVGRSRPSDMIRAGNLPVNLVGCQDLLFISAYDTITASTMT